MSSKIKLLSFLALLIGITSQQLTLAVGGGGGGAASDSIPLPTTNYSATVTDSTSISLKAERLSWNGKVYFDTQVGNSKIVIPFEKVGQLTIKRSAKNTPQDYVLGEFELLDGQTVEALLLMDSKLYGQTSFGNFELFVRDLEQISFN